MTANAIGRVTERRGIGRGRRCGRGHRRGRRLGRVLPQGQIQVGLELAGRLMTILGAHRGGPFDHADEGVGQVGPHVAQPAARRADLVLPPYVHGGEPVHGVGARGQVVEQHTDAVDVGHRRAHGAREGLGRQVERRPGRALARRLVDLHVGAGAEVHEHGAAAGGPHHVLRLDVAVQHLQPVHRRQRAADVDADVHRLLGAERPVLRDQVLQRAAANQLHREAHLLADPLGAEHADHVVVPHLRQHPGLAQRLLRVGLRVGSRADDLQRDLEVEVGVDGAVDGAVGAVADFGEDRKGAPGGRDGVAQPREAFDHAQLVEHRRRRGVGRGRGVRPVHRDAVGDRRRHRQDVLLSAGLRAHGPSPRPAGPVPGSRPCVRRPRWACPATRPLRRVTAPARRGR